MLKIKTISSSNVADKTSQQANKVKSPYTRLVINHINYADTTNQDHFKT